MIDREFQQLGNYRIIRHLGGGGFGEVYLGEHILLNTPAAIKVLNKYSVGPKDFEGFLVEARMIASLEHPNIIRMLDFGIKEESNIPFLIMQYAPNGTLRQRFPDGTILSYKDIVTFTKQISSALDYAHHRRVIHRDIKPENMLIASNDDILLSDFGLAITAHSTESQVPVTPNGTVAYIAPEQLEGNPRPASDQYSLGIVVYEWICGCRPFVGAPDLVLYHHVHTPPHLFAKKYHPSTLHSRRLC